MLKLNQGIILLVVILIMANSVLAQFTVTNANHFFRLDASNSSWTDTGLQLSIGEEYIFWTVGWFTLNTDTVLRPDTWSSPDGRLAEDPAVPFDGGSLISKIGQTSTELEIGTFISIRAEVSGTLFLKIYDPGPYSNNLGFANVLVYGPIERPHSLGISKNSNINKPNTIRLSQNYPNPFNPKCTINYEIQQNGNVEINVYNSIGQKVKTLINEIKNAGEHSVIWDGTDDNQKILPSGQYYYKLRVGDYISSKKMILLR